MAKQFTVTATVNGGSSLSHEVVVKTDEPLFSNGWLWRMFAAFGFVAGEAATFEYLSISGPTTVSDPLSWSDVPPTVLITAIGHGISLAFID